MHRLAKQSRPRITSNKAGIALKTALRTNGTMPSTMSKTFPRTRLNGPERRSGQWSHLEMTWAMPTMPERQRDATTTGRFYARMLFISRASSKYSNRCRWITRGYIGFKVYGV